MAKVRNFTAGDTSRIWELLNAIGAAVNPVTQDSGNLDAVLNGGAAAWGGSAQIRRVGDTVWAQGYITVATGSTFIGKNREGTAFLTVPTGFKPIYRAYPIGLGSASYSGGTALLRWDVDTSRLLLTGAAGTWSAGHSLAFSASWITNEGFVG